MVRPKSFLIIGFIGCRVHGGRTISIPHYEIVADLSGLHPQICASVLSFAEQIIRKQSGHADRYAGNADHLF